MVDILELTTEEIFKRNCLHSREPEVSMSTSCRESRECPACGHVELGPINLQAQIFPKGIIAVYDPGYLNTAVNIAQTMGQNGFKHVIEKHWVDYGVF